MSTNPKTIDENDLAISALKLMEEYRIADLIVTNIEMHPIGIVDLKDLLKAGVI